MPAPTDAGEGLDEAAARIWRASRAPVRWLAVSTGAAALPALSHGHALTHAGPPLRFARMCAPMRRALAGAAFHEGWASDLAAAETLIASGAVALHANHDAGAVAPMAGVIAPSFPVALVARQGAAPVVTNFCEGVGRALRFGAVDEAVLRRLDWIRDVLAPALAQALPPDGIDLGPLVARAASMGDDLHQRNEAFTALLALRLGGLAPEALAFLAETPQSGLNLVMATAKAVLDAGRDVPGSSVVVAIARNGVQVGVQLAGTGSRWSTAAAPVPTGRMLAGMEERSPCPDIGDSAITEAWGLGGWLAPSAPEVVRAVGGPPALARMVRDRAARAAVAPHPLVRPAAWGDGAPPLALDARHVVAQESPPVVFTGMADARGEAGQIGVGHVEVPLAAFASAVAQLDAVPAQVTR